MRKRAESRYVKTDVIFGFKLEEFPVGTVQLREDRESAYTLKGNNQKVEFDDTSVLQKHVLFIGATGVGKTNAIFQLVKEIKSKMTEKDAMIIFDTKGDYLLEFYEAEKGDVAISVNKNGYYNYQTWNIFKDIIGKNENEQQITAFEIISTLFDDAIRRSQNPFFPQAARDIALAITLNILRKKGQNASNEDLREIIFGGGASRIFALLNEYEDTKWAAEYISPRSVAQAQGVYGELTGALYPILKGPFGEAGTFSIKNFVSSPSKKTLFFVFGVNTSKALTPVYKVMYDLAIKEVLSRERFSGKVYFVVDEFSLLPLLNYIENGINFGRGLGARFIVSVQNISQMMSAYGEYRGGGILSGFGSIIAFKLFDKSSRDFVSQRYGKHIKNLKVKNKFDSENTKQLSYVTGNVIEDWDISGLKQWEAILCLPRLNPGRFTFEKYVSRKYEM